MIKIKSSYISDEPDFESESYVLDSFDSKFADEIHTENKDLEKRVYIYTKPHVGSDTSIGYFSDFAPSIVYAINKYDKESKFHLPFRESSMKQYGYCKLSQLYCTLDKSIMFGFHNKHVAQSKILNLKSIATILGHNKLIIDVEDLHEENIVEMMFQVKKNANKLLGYVEAKHDNFLLKKQKKHNLKYVDELKETFKKNLVSILLYGSSATGKGSDYDNIVVLKNLPKDLYKKIRGMALMENGKEVGIIFVPEYNLEKFLHINVSNILFKENSRVLYGEVNLPIEPESYSVVKERFHSAYGSSKLISALNLVYKEPEIFYDKPGLFEYFMKLNRFTLRGLKQEKEKYKVFEKEELVDCLWEEYNSKMPEFKPDADYIKKCFLEENELSVELAKDYYSPAFYSEEREVLLEIKKPLGGKAYLSEYNNKPVFLFASREKLRNKDIVPAKILKDGETGYDTRQIALGHTEIQLPKEYFIAKRL